MNYGYREATAADHYDAILDHLDALQDKCKDEADKVSNLQDDLEDARDEASLYKDEALTAKARLNTAYSQRAIAAIALAHTVLSYGGTAGVGLDNREDQPSNWRVVLYVDTPAGQLSWHISPEDQPMLEGLPEYIRAWDGTYNSSNNNFYKGFKQRG